jgi:acyl dehydratase
VAVKHFEDFRVGETLDLGSHTVTLDEVLAYARRWDPQPFHVDPEAARQSIYGGLIASGWHTCAILMRLGVEAQRREGAAGVGSPGVESCRWLRPVRPGDTLAARSQVLETWPSRSRPWGFARRRVEMQNQHGETALRLVGISMYTRREGAVPALPSGGGPSPVAPGAGGAVFEVGTGAAVSAAVEAGGAAGPEPAAPGAPAGSPDDPAWYEDVSPGETWRFGRYEVTREEILDFARQFDPQPFHLDEEAARRSIYGGLIASGWHTGAMFISMVAEHTTRRWVTAGAKGFDDLRWLLPVRPGDVLSVASTVVEREPPRRPDRATVRVQSRVLNQRGEAVMTLISPVVFLRRSGAAGAS